MAEVVRVEDLSFSYPGFKAPALDKVSLSAETGDFLLLAGPSGAGKSTLIRCLNGLVPHFSGGKISGTVEVDGIDVLTAGPQVLSRKIGFVFQDPEAQMVLDTVEAEIAFGLENLAFPHGQIHVKLNEILELLDLARIRNRPVADLSGGERQRVAIASALVLQPKVLVLDEPTSQLDPDSAREILTHIRRIKDRYALTVILVEHRLERITRFANRLAYMEAGKIITEGPLRETIDRLPPDQQPPLTRLADALHWHPLPVTSAEGRLLAPVISPRKMPPAAAKPAKNGKGKAKTLVLQGQALEYDYGRQRVLRGVDIALAAGEATALIGANGSGKSTLLKCLVGLLRPSRGEITLDGHPTASKSVAEICRQVAYLPQAPDDLLFSDSVHEELQATLNNHGISPADNMARVDKLLGELGLGNLAATYPRDLSVGQRQRVALGAIMITQPRLLLLDEPTRGLDYAAKQMLTRLWSSWQKQGMGILLVTHDMELVARVADRVLVLKDGQISESGPVNEMLGSGSLYGSQMARLFPESGLLTVHDALDELDSKSASDNL